MLNNIYMSPTCPPGCSHVSCAKEGDDWTHERINRGTLTPDAALQLTRHLVQFHTIISTEKWFGIMNPDAISFGSWALINNAETRARHGIPVTKHICPTCGRGSCVRCPINYIAIAQEGR